MQYQSMNTYVVELIQICRAKLITEASIPSPHLLIIVAHANLLEVLLSTFGTDEDWKPDPKSSSGDSSIESTERTDLV